MLPRIWFRFSKSIQLDSPIANGREGLTYEKQTGYELLVLVRVLNFRISKKIDLLKAFEALEAESS